jgi:enediyne biosynthesis protein E4
MRISLVTGTAVFLAVLGLSLGCQRPEGPPRGASGSSGPVWFRDATEEVGLDFRHEAGPVGRYFMPQIMGSGAAVLDFDNDGLFDLYLVQNGGPNSPAKNRLFRGRPGGRFEDVSVGSGLDIAGHCMGVAVGDFDNDGWVDVYVSQYGGGRLFRNKGDGTFEDVTRAAGVEQPGWGTSCCFVDYDRDGWLDLVVVHYVDYDPAFLCGPGNGTNDYCHPRVFQGKSMRLLHNRGRDAGGRWLGFEDVTYSAGVAKKGPGLGVLCADFNGDGWPDIFVANDSHPNYLWINRKDGTFADEAVARGLAYNGVGQPQANMGVTLGDVSGDGRLGLFVTHLTEETHTLWQQTGAGSFQDRTIAAGLSGSRWHGTGFGTVLADFDLDGAPDLAVVNGRVARSRTDPPPVCGLAPYWGPYAERNQLFINDGRGRFRDISLGNEAFCGSFSVGRGLLWGDFNGDGRLDLVVTYVAGPARYYRNVASLRGHWLTVRAVDPALHRDAIGARVTVHAGARRWIGLINPGQSYLCSGDPRAHFGLGPAGRVDSIRIDWPDGLAEVFPGTAVDRALRLERGQGQKVDKEQASQHGR